MLSPHAYSFRQQARLAISLSWIAGYTNVIALIVFSYPISHATGNTTWFGRLLVRPEQGDELLSVEKFGYLLLTFFLGAVCSAFMTEKADRRGISSRYIPPIATEALLLLVLPVYGWFHANAGFPFWLLGTASFAMGLQNATITKISGAVVRTTHVTGVVTDLGLEGVQLFLWWWDRIRIARPGRFGRVLRISRRHPTLMRVLLLASIYGSFLTGAMAGAMIFHYWHITAMLLPVVTLLWIVGVDFFKPIGAVTELDLLGDPELKLYGIVKSLLPPELGIYRVSHHRQNAAHHAPNFKQWVDRMAAHRRVVILVVTALTKFDDEAVADLRNAAMQMRDDRRRLVISGINPGQYKMLARLGLAEELETEDFCPDLEFAIARGIALARNLGVDESAGAGRA